MGKVPSIPNVVIHLNVDVARSELAQVLAELSALAGNALTVQVDNPPKDEPESRDVRLFSEVVADYVEDRQEAWSDKTKGGYLATFRLFEDALGNPAFRSIDVPMLREARRKLRRLPPGWRKSPQFRALTFSEVLRLQEKLERKGEIETVDIATVNKWWDTLKPLFEWAVRLKHTDCNYADGLNIPSRAAEDDESRRAFTESELETIFQSSFFQPGGYESPTHYWAPVLSYMAGTRVNELGQTPLMCVKRDEQLGIVYIDMRRKAGFDLKNTASQRILPIHPEVAEAFWDYCERMRSLGHTRVFPDLPSEGRDGPGRGISRFINDTLLEQLNIKDPEVVAHSFRHFFVQALEKAGVEDKWVRRLAGHAGKTSLADYGGKPPHDVMFTQLIKAEFPVVPPRFEWMPVMSPVELLRLESREQRERLRRRAPARRPRP